ncbi:MAG: peptidylprolyl isomerase [Ignavibacteria bacterium]|nr:peptidylprolyl isomerase [Ignavibacteria bacterium]
MKTNRFLGIYCLIFIVFFLSNTYSQQKSKTKKATSNQNVKETVIATVGNEKITYSDIEKAYSKNLAKKSAPLHLLPKDSLMDFLNLYIRYRLKVNDAIARGLDKDSATQEEIKNNRRLLAETFFFEKELVTPNVEKMLKYRDWEAQISYIFLQFPPDNPDTLSTFNRAMKLIEMLKNGTDFAKLAKDSSQDKESAERGGLVLNFLTGGKVQRQIEDAVFSLKPGEFYKSPIRTKFGYFIIKLNKLQPRIKVKGRHILIAVTPERDSVAALKKADSLYKLLKSGSKFEILAEENSDDPSSSMRGGDFGGWYSRSGGLEPSGRFFTSAFEEALFSLKDGEISQPIRTEYGYHIIRRDSTGYFNKDEDKDDLKRTYKRLYFETDKKELIDNLQKQYGFFVNDANLNKLLSFIDTTKTVLDTAWFKNIPNEINKDILFGIQNKLYSIEDFLKTLKTRPEFRTTALNRTGLRNAMNKIVYPIVMDKATSNLENEVPEFASMVKEFSDGILLFKVEAMEVWDKLKLDTTLARQHWEKNKSKYRTYAIFDVNEIYVLSDSLANQIYKKITQEGADFEEMASQFTQRANFREKKGHWGKISAKDNNLAKKLLELNATAGNIVGPFKYDDGYSIVRINSYEPEREKTFEEAIPDFATEVQEILQKRLLENWLSQAQKRIPVKIFDQKLTSVVNALKKQN